MRMIQMSRAGFVGAAMLLVVSACREQSRPQDIPSRGAGEGMMESRSQTDMSEINMNDAAEEKVVKSDEEWRKKLTPSQYEVARCGGTERAFTGKYWNHHGDGMYQCACCGAALFDSKTKFDSGSGWPSFFKPAETSRVGEKQDRSHGMIRTEVTCNRCGAHLGHVFDDGPSPTGLRYCINSASLDFKERPKE